MKQINDTAHKAFTVVQDIGLLVIAIATVISMGTEVMLMVENQTVSLADLLLLFIYLEVLSMVVHYLDSGQLPVRMPLYICIVALARYMILDMKHLNEWQMLSIAGTAFILACTVMLIRYGHIKYPYPSGDDH